jgi:hypothetical protein
MRCAISGVIRLTASLALAIALTDASFAADVASCNDVLARMQGDRRDIAARANDVATAIEQFEMCARQNASSGNVPDSCRRQADEYQKAVARLNGALDSADNRVRTVGGSCVQPPAPAPVVAPAARPAPQPVVVAPPPVPVVAPPAAAAAAPQPPPINDASCDTALSYKGKIPYEGVVKICLRTLSEAQCRQCLGSLENK